MNVIFSYTRKQAIEDGVLVDVSNMAKEAGIRISTAVTTAVWAEYVAVPPGVTGQDEDGRLWDILWMLRFAVLQQKSRDSLIRFELFVRNEEAKQAERVTLKAEVGPGDDLRPVLTIMLPNEN